MRNLPPDFDPSVAAAIDARLDAVECEHNVRILLAIESGSRAWGFPSPDSDYDCRFIFVRPQADYLSLWPKRDVIETPLDPVLDVNGWDLAKALKLMLKGNAVVLEWLRSPIAYRGYPAIRDELLALATRHADRDAIGRHYLHLGEKQWHKLLPGTGRGTSEAAGGAQSNSVPSVPLKKLLYALRPAVALRWLRLYPDQTVPPMHFPTLLTECYTPQVMAREVTDLLARKAQTRELGEGAPPPTIAEFIDDEFEAGQAVFGESEGLIPDHARMEANELFRRTINQYCAPEQRCPRNCVSEEVQT